MKRSDESGVISEEREKVVQDINKKSLQDVFDNVPGGVIMYDWDGKDLKVVKISKYYKEQYGYSFLGNENSPDFMHIHPEDIAEYKKAIHHALTVTHSLEYVVRVWKQNQNKYGWMKITAVSKEQANGHSYVYAMYTDVTEQKIAEQRLKKSNASIVAALGAAEQFSYEYDPIAHTSTCFTDTDNGYGLEREIYNFPECFRENNFMHPDDVELFIQTVHKIDEGAENAHCEIRANKEGRYHWHSCTFDAFYDTEKERRVALLTVVDITPQKTAMRSYENRLQMLIRANEDAMCMCDVNLTKNQFFNVQAKYIIKEYGEKAENLDQLLQMVSIPVFDQAEQMEFRKLFNRKRLLELFEKDESHIAFRHFYRVNKTYTQWVETVFDLVTEPITGDVVGICYAKSLNNSKMSRILLNAALDKDYPMAALVYADSGEYYFYEVQRGAFCEHKQDYWANVAVRLKEAADVSGLTENPELTEIYGNMTKEKVIISLERSGEYSYTFYGFYNGIKCRLEAKFRYIDKEHNLLIATLRNITDTALYRKYKHDSEHDPLTGLLNRNTLFRKCNQLLKEHPEQQFAVLHCDIRHFHLYNTFFGENEGDKLLCKIAELMTNVEKDYSYWVYGRIEADVFCAFFSIDNEVFERHVHYFFDEISKIRDDFPIEPTIGVYKVDDLAVPVESMFTRATIAAKTQRNNMFGMVSCYDASMNQELNDTQQIISEMNTAIAQEQFKVYLQPKYSLRSERLTGAEALVRWIHPERGMISPGKFIPVFEKNGFIAELDRYMWKHVCQILKKWSDEGREMYPVSVNISRVSMYNRGTVSFLKSLIQKYNIDSKYLELELTESAYMDDPEELKRMLKELQEYGFKILMDDFGSGYSSLNTLRDLPVDVLKLDMKFLSETQNDKRGAAVLTSVVRMSKLLNLPIVAEGVEKETQANYLRDIGCEYVQGFLFARPMPVVEYERLLSECRSGKTEEISKEETSISLASADVIMEDPLVSIGILEYENEKFAYLRTNKNFLKEFDLIENLKPASKVFREHLDAVNYEILLQAFESCSKTKKESLFRIQWAADDGMKRMYHGYVHYNGNIGNYSDLSVTFVNVTEMNTFGF